MSDCLIAFAHSLKPYFNNPAEVNPRLLRLKIMKNPVRVTPSCQSKLTPCTKICLTLFAKIKMSPVGI